MSNLAHRQNTILKVNSSDSTRPDFAGSYDVTAYAVGAVVSAAATTNTPAVDAGHSFRVSDKFIVGTDATKYHEVSAVTATQLTLANSETVTVVVGDQLVNLGPDTGASSPNYDASHLVIYSDSDGSTAISNSRVTASASGEYSYYHKGDGRFWELIRDGDGTVVDAVKGFGSVQGRYNVCDYGAAGDGSTDDAGAIQAAIDAAESELETVWIAPHSFIIKTELTVDTAGLSVEFAPGSTVDITGMTGAGTASVHATVNVLSAFKVTAARARFCGYGALITGPSSVDGKNSVGILLASGADDFYAEGLRFTTLYTSIWSGGGISNYRVHNLHLDGMSHNMKVGYDEAVGTSPQVNKAVISQMESENSTNDGLKLASDAEDIQIIGGHYHDNTKDGIDTFVSGEYVSIIGVHCYDNTTSGIDIKTSTLTGSAAAEGGFNRRMIVQGCILEGNTGSGISVVAGKIFTGTHTGSGNASVLTDSAAAFADLVGMIVYNDTDGSSGIITATTATTVTATLAGGTDNDWDASDAYTIDHMPEGIVIDGNIARDNTGHAFSINMSNSVLSNNVAIDNKARGFNILSCRDCIISGNVAKMNNTSTQTEGFNFGLRSGAATAPKNTRLSVIGNVAYGSGAASGQQTGLSVATANIENSTFMANISSQHNTADWSVGASSTGMRYTANTGLVTEASGTASIASGATSVVVTHGLGLTPTIQDITVTIAENPTNTPGAVWIDTFTSTQFTVNCENDPGASNMDVGWKALITRSP